ncbi:SubName: Full=Related to serine/threonine-protein kinase Chk2 {ECO:0000313/EMBL:CCA68550.1} [Serendipita indica DSM 11827]|nr:SubName: Full=Related to serine/threonine-protein kinase Chk2 {ECO:0000313/EMBL:CCA68550.1} [Serendipita indica DSM 11827]
MPATTITNPDASLSTLKDKKRKIVDEDASPVKKKRVVPAESTAAVLSTRNAKTGRVDKLFVKVGYPVLLGRRSSCDYVLHEPSVSSKHCVIHAGNVGIVCQDYSSNGVLINGHVFTGKQSLLLMEGDVLTLPNSQSFTCQQFLSHYIQANNGLEGPSRVGNYIITGKRLGSGAYSSVHLAVDVKTARQAACKTIIRKTQADIDDVLREVRLLRQLRHPNINAVYGFHTSGANLQAIHSWTMGYIYERRISHRDLKPENVLLCTPGSFPRVVIADFGLARENSYEPTANVAGTVSYLPPEAINALAWREMYSSETTDSWALGLLVFIMLQGFHPFDPIGRSKESRYPYNNVGELDTPAHSEEVVRRRIVQKEKVFKAEDWVELALGANPEDFSRDFISALLIRDIQKRAKIRDAMHHPWITRDIASLKAAYLRYVEQPHTR